MHQGQCRSAHRVLQVQVVVTDLIGQQQALVHNGSRGHAGHVILFAVLELESLDRTGCGFSDHVQLSLKRVLHNDIGTPSDEELSHHRLLGPHTGRHGHLPVGGHITPADHHLALCTHGTLKLLFTGQT